MGFSQRETEYNWNCLWKTHFIILNKSSRPVFCGKLTWRNLKGLAELANLTVSVVSNRVFIDQLTHTLCKQDKNVCKKVLFVL